MEATVSVISPLQFQFISPNVYLLKVPFEDIYTSVFAIKTVNGDVIIDTATTDADINDIIIPAIEKAELSPYMLIVSHFHHDHAGGVKAFLKKYPSCKLRSFDAPYIKSFTDTMPTIIQNGEEIFPKYKAYNLKAHSPDSMILYNKESGVLLAFDCLQQFGVGGYGTGLYDAKAYLESIDFIEGLSPSLIISSHSFVPMGNIAKEGSIKEYLNASRYAIDLIKKYSAPHKSNEDSAEHFKKSRYRYIAENSSLPPIPAGTFRAVSKLVI